MKSQLNTLQLVYPPISNQEAEWLKDDEAVQETIRQSNLYMICHRAEAFFEFPNTEDIKKTLWSEIPFSIVCGNHKGHGVVDTSTLFSDDEIDHDKNNIKIEIGEKLLRFREVSKETGELGNVVEWFTVDKLLYDRWRGHPLIKGLDNYRVFTGFTLRYVGISKASDSLTRLVIKPHDKRIRVLSNERSINEGSRVTDELLLLFFKVDPLRITTLGLGDDINETLVTDGFDKIPIIADAEKAYIRVLDSQYNTEKYANYPDGEDGLYGTGLTRYAYILGEDITLITEKDNIRGGFASEYHLPNDRDFILVEGDAVTLIKYDKIK